MSEEKIESRLLKKDKIDIVLKILQIMVIPIVVAIFSFYSQKETSAILIGQQNEATRIAQELQKESNNILQQQQTTYDNLAKSQEAYNESDIISKYIDLLASGNDLKVQLAITGLTLGLPNDSGKKILDQLSNCPEIQNNKVIIARDNNFNIIRMDLIKSLFAFEDDYSIRSDALNKLVNSWNNDPNVIDDIISYSKDIKGKNLKYYNALYVINRMQINILIEKKAAVSEYLDKVSKIDNRPVTTKEANEIRKKIDN